MISIIILALIVAQAIISLLWAHLRAYRLSTYSWEQLQEKLQPVGLQGLQIVATTPVLANVAGGLGSEDLWDLLGGSQGLSRLENNARIMVALADFMERKNNLEKMVLAERMRADGATVRSTIRSIRITRCVSLQTEALHAQLHEAAMAYAAMKSRIPALYEMSHGVTYFEPLGA